MMLNPATFSFRLGERAVYDHRFAAVRPILDGRGCFRALEFSAGVGHDLTMPLEPGIDGLVDLCWRSSGTAASRSGRFVYIKTYFMVLLLSM